MDPHFRLEDAFASSEISKENFSPVVYNFGRIDHVGKYKRCDDMSGQGNCNLAQPKPIQEDIYLPVAV